MREPVYDGYFADPFLTTFDGGFVAYGSGPSDARGPRRFEAIRSADLGSWTSVGPVLEIADASLGGDYWAPEVVFADNAWWMYYSVGHGIAGHHLRVARAETALGPFTDLGIDLTPDERFAIDAHPFLDVDGTWYLFYARDVLDGPKRGTHLAVHRMNDMTSLEAHPVAALAPDADWQLYQRDRRMYGLVKDWYTLEGPSVLRRAGVYYLFFSGGSWEGAGYGVSFATATSPLGPWTHTEAAAPDVLSSAITGLVGPGHNSLLDIAADAALIAYHAWDTKLTRRQMYIDTLTWAGGTPTLATGVSARG